MIVLASSSPRRRALLDAAGIAHRDVAVLVDESPLPDRTPAEVAVLLAERKARAAAVRVAEGLARTSHRLARVSRARAPDLFVEGPPPTRSGAKPGLLLDLGSADSTRTPCTSVRSDAPRRKPVWNRKFLRPAARSDEQSGLVLGADTIVVLDGEILGKPASEEHARLLLARLSGREHEVVTGVCLLDAATGRARTRAVSSRVRFREIGSEEIGAYVATGEPLDKAGAYGIQGGAAAFVEELVGSRDNVIGLPVDEVREMLAEAGA